MITRLRPKKVDKTSIYKVVDLDDLTDYTEYSHVIHTGMEADEEKEVHIKKIMTGEKVVISVPEILPARVRKVVAGHVDINKKYNVNLNNDTECKTINDENESKVNSADIINNKAIINNASSGNKTILMSPYTQPKELIKYDKDVQNFYILDHEDEKICDENIFRKIIQELKNKSEKDLINECMNEIKNTSHGGVDTSNGIDNSKDNIDKISPINKSPDTTLINNSNNDTPDTTQIYNNNSIGDLITTRDNNIIADIIKSVSAKTIRLVDDNDAHPYLCFRKRVIKSGRKSRRNESICVEKLRRLYTEFYIIKKLVELKEKRDAKKKELLMVEKKIYRMIFDNKFGKGITDNKHSKGVTNNDNKDITIADNDNKGVTNNDNKDITIADNDNKDVTNNDISINNIQNNSFKINLKRKYIKKLLKRNSSNFIPFYKTCSFQEMQTNENKIFSLKRILSFVDLKIDDSAIEKELEVLKMIDDN